MHEKESAENYAGGKGQAPISSARSLPGGRRCEGKNALGAALMTLVTLTSARPRNENTLCSSPKEGIHGQLKHVL